MLLQTLTTSDQANNWKLGRLLHLSESMSMPVDKKVSIGAE